MFEVGEFIIYGSNGVCKIEDVGTVDIAGLPKDKVFYTLVPVYSKGSKVFTPTDNKKVTMRPIITKEEAWMLIDDIDKIETLWLTDDKKSEEIYKEALRKCDCREWIKIIKTLNLRKKARKAEGKKIIAGDEKYLRLLEECLFGELAIPLEMDKDEVEGFITSKVELLEMV